MVDYKKHTSEEIRKLTNENGESLLNIFKQDFKEKLGYDVCETCPDFDRKYAMFLNIYENPKNATGYLLYKKYEGISYPFGHSASVFNHSMTDDDVTRLLPLHEQILKDNGEGIFQVTPKTTTFVDSIELGRDVKAIKEAKRGRSI